MLIEGNMILNVGI